jgi:hypothetical protein
MNFPTSQTAKYFAKLSCEILRNKFLFRISRNKKKSTVVSTIHPTSLPGQEWAEKRKETYTTQLSYKKVNCTPLVPDSDLTVRVRRYFPNRGVENKLTYVYARNTGHGGVNQRRDDRSV